MWINIISWIIGVLGIFATVWSWFQNKRRVITVTQKKSVNVNQSNFGSFEFDYSNFNGVFVIGKGEYQFDTRWSKASNVSIHAYTDSSNIESLGLIKDDIDLRKIKSVECDFTSRCRCPHVSQSIVWKNIYGHYAITKIVSIKDDSRGDDCDYLKCDYVILEDK